jgi:hypothetical protein
MAEKIPGQRLLFVVAGSVRFQERAKEHDQVVRKMNKRRRDISGKVQCAAPRLANMIDGARPKWPAAPRSPEVEEITMLKTISAALLATSMIAAPALAVDSTNAQIQANKTTQTHAQTRPGKTGQAQIGAKATRQKSNKLNANAKMIRHHRHKKISLHRSHPKVSFNHVATTRG